MLMLILVLILAAVVILEAVLIFWLARTIKKNMNVQAAVTAQLLEDMAEAHYEEACKILRKYHRAKTEAQQKSKIIEDLEASVETLHTEVVRLEEINRLEHDIKNG